MITTYIYTDLYVFMYIYIYIYIYINYKLFIIFYKLLFTNLSRTEKIYGKISHPFPLMQLFLGELNSPPFFMRGNLSYV